MAASSDHFPTQTAGLPEARSPESHELAHGDRFDLRIAPVAKRIGDARVRMLAYNGSIPGPTLRVQQGSELVGGDSGRCEREGFVERVLIAPSERAVVDVSFDQPGQLTLEHHTPDRTYRLATIRVSEEPAAPSLAREFESLRAPADMAAEIDRATGAEGAAIDWRFRVGDRVKIRLVNELDSDHPMPHPFHVHGAGRFLVLTRDGVVEPNLVWKDTVLVPTGQTVDILLDVSNPGMWMAHCHIAEHHESGMMFSFTVDP